VLTPELSRQEREPLQLEINRKKPVPQTEKPDAYNRIIERIFFRHYGKKASSIEFTREEIPEAAKELKVPVPDNLGDVIYSFRYRRSLPSSILKTCGAGQEWIIESVGTAKYKFRKVSITKIEPQAGLYQIKVPEATPEIVAQHALSDEQALLAKLRYNRLIDIFTGLTTYSLQNHLRTQIKGIQLEIDELYVGIGKSGDQVIIPVQAKGGRDRIGRVQLVQDLAFCKERFSHLTCRPIAAQFMGNDVIAMFELTVLDDKVQIVEEKHYKLVPASDISVEDLATMRRGVARSG
jgi:hypothetical protein